MSTGEYVISIEVTSTVCHHVDMSHLQYVSCEYVTSTECHHVEYVFPSVENSKSYLPIVLNK